MPLNPRLVQMATTTIRKQAALNKNAVQPPPGMGGGDPSGGGAPPPDPSMGGGGGAPPPGMDPSMAGGAPPGMDPSMGGGAPPPPSPPPDSGTDPLAAVMQKLDQLTQTMQAGPANQAGPGGSPGGPGKPGKPDLLAMSMDIFQMKKMLFTIANAMGIEPPQEIIDGPNRDPSTGAPMQAGAPGSTSDPNTMAQADAQQAKPPQSAIKPIQGIQGAMPTSPDASKSAQYNGIGKPFDSIGKGDIKKASAGAKSVQNNASALATMLRAKKK